MAVPPYSVAPDPDVAQKLVRLGELEEAAVSLRHDVREMLTSTLLMADVLLTHADPVVSDAGGLAVNAITRVIERLG